MIGNDLVDLSLARKAHRWQDPRFARKLFTDSELNYLYAQPNFFETIWRLWSIKESAYKAYSKITGKTFIDPHTIICEVESASKGFAYVEQCTFNVSSTTTSDYTYSLATAKDNTILIDQLHKAENHSLPNIRNLRDELLFDEIRRLESTRGKLSIAKNQNGIPFLLQDNSPLKLPITFTHHGRYFAFAVGERTFGDGFDLSDAQPNKIRAVRRVLV